MTPGEIRNDFLLDLLALQQDGKYAISAPANWTTHEPLLEVTTEVDSIIDELQGSMLSGNNQNEIARWHFFIGSPGNGKSAAMGKLCRRLMSAEGCQVRDEKGVLVSELEPAAIPYALNVYEGSNKFASAQIVQDASVVRNPFSPDVNPAAELLHTLEHAWEKGISLIVCTNRGILEKAYSDNHVNREVNTKPWFKIIVALVSANTALMGEIGSVRPFDERKTVFSKLKVGYSHLDNRSLLLGTDTFARLLQNATSSARWETCTSCSFHRMCPFVANRDWLVHDQASKQVLKVLTRAEALSGQVIVFREALAIISLFLAGCPRDYHGLHPCEWVQDRVTSQDIFALASRRIYMSLFASYCPYGLEAVEALRKRQLEALCGLRDAVEGGQLKAREAIRHIDETDPPSTDVGVTRLLGENGIIASLDPCREALPDGFYDRWDSDFDAVPGSPLLTEIERSCLSIWKELEECLGLAAGHSVTEVHWALRRWTSNFLLHLGALLEGRSARGEELDAFANLLGLMAIPPEDRSLEDKRTIRQLDARLENLLNSVAGGQSTGTIQLSEAVALTGEWVREQSKPRTVGSETSGSVSLAVEFPGGERAVFGAPMYLWLRLMATGRLDARCFPQELLTGLQDARVRAAARGKYAFENNDVELVVDTGAGALFRLTRLDGDVDVAHERNDVRQDSK